MTKSTGSPFPQLRGWQVRFSGGAEFTGASDGWPASAEEAASREGVSFITLGIPPITCITIPAGPTRRLIRQQRVIRPREWRDFQHLTDESGYRRYLALGYVEGAAVVEAHIDLQGRLMLFHGKVR